MLEKSYAHSQQLGYSLSSSLGKPPLFPASFNDIMDYEVAVNSAPTNLGYRQQHDINCPRHPARKNTQLRERSRSIGGMETSITSLHSSGQDSGIADNGGNCQCGQSSGHSSGEESSK